MKDNIINKKNIILVIIVIILVTITVIGSYALAIWTSRENTELTMRIGNVAGVFFENGPNINVSNIGPIFDYEQDGETTYFSMLNYTTEEVPINISLKITSISDNLKSSDFKYVVTSSVNNGTYNVINTGDFSSASNGTTFPLVENYSLAVNNAINFKIIIYIDGNSLNSNTLHGGSLNGVISISESSTPQYETFASAIMNLSSGTTWSSGASGLYQVNHTMSDGTTATEYRYVGAEVNNYVSFNDDLYRIIGVFDDNTHGVEGEMLVKLISANVLTASAYGVYNSTATSGTYSSYANDWTGSITGVKANLNVLLNEYFYNKTNTSSTYGACSNWTYYSNGTNYRTNDCSDIVGYGLTTESRNYLENATWYLYGYSGNGLSKQNFYLCERGDYDGCTSGNSGAYDTSTNAKIGLMYVSDYMYASGYYSEGDTTTGSSYYYGNKNWLYKGYEWMITPRSSSAVYAFSVSSIGYVYYGLDSYYGSGARPTFYLKSTVKVTGGTGSFDNPYTISL